MKVSHRIILVLRTILKDIVELLLIFIFIIIIYIIIHICTKGYVDWDHFTFNIFGKYRETENVSIQHFSLQYCIVFVPIILILCIQYFISPDKTLPKCYDDKYRRRFLQKFVILDYVPEITDINESFSHIMQDKSFRSILDKILLVPLIVTKINIIRKMNVSEKYQLFYTQNVQGLNIGLLSTYNTSSVEIQALLKKIYVPKYMYFTIISTKDEQNNILNGDKYKNKDDSVLQLVFNQKLILKKIVLEVFLHESEENNIIKNNILKQIKGYYNNTLINTNKIIEQIQDNKNSINNSTNNILMETNKDKRTLLINIIKENIKNNKIFRERFCKVLHSNSVSTDINTM